jgi:hypothetical protein
MFLSANNTGLNAAANSVNASKSINAPAGIKTTAQAAQEALTSKTGTSSGMGQKDFLTLFTTQLKCQDPLDPVKNEAFVAQLAQFSQLEATTGMADTLKGYVDSMAGERMMSSTSMIGKTVAAPGAPAVITQGGRPAQGFVSLPTGAEGVKIRGFQRQRPIGHQPSHGRPKALATCLLSGTAPATLAAKYPMATTASKPLSSAKAKPPTLLSTCCPP